MEKLHVNHFCWISSKGLVYLGDLLIYVRDPLRFFLYQGEQRKKEQMWVYERDLRSNEHYLSSSENETWKKIQACTEFFFRPYFHYSSSSVHYCEDLFHIHIFIHSSNIWLSYTHICLHSERLYLYYHNSKNTVVNETCSYLLPWPLPFCS